MRKGKKKRKANEKEIEEKKEERKSKGNRLAAALPLPPSLPLRESIGFSNCVQRIKISFFVFRRSRDMKRKKRNRPLYMHD